MAQPRTIGRYLVDGVLGRGGMGVVYRARDPSGRVVALKLLTEDGGPDSPLRRRFEAEVRATTRLRHPGIVAVHEVGSHEGRPFLALELVAGESLEKALARAPIEPLRLAAIVHDVALALEHAHREGVLHRDVKPENVLLDADGRPRLVDFGLARDVRTLERLTQGGDLVGTPAYMAPEQAGGESEAQGPRTDVYGLGGLLYRGLAGAPPFEAPSVPALLTKVLVQPPEPPHVRAPGASRELEAIALRCLEKDPGRRYPSARSVADELERFLAGDPPRARGSSADAPLAVPSRDARKLLTVGIVALVTAAGAIGAGARGVAWLEAERRVSADLERAARRREAEESALALRRAELSRLLERAGILDVTRDAAEREALAGTLETCTDADSVGTLTSALEQATSELRGVLRAVHASVADPLPEERARGDAPLPLLERWLDREEEAWLAPVSPAERPGSRRLLVSEREIEQGGLEPAVASGLAAARARIARRAEGSREGVVAWRVVAREQARRGAAACARAALLVRALGKPGAPAAVVLALSRHLVVVADEGRALGVAEAIWATGSERGRSVALWGRRRWKTARVYPDGLARLLRRTAVACGDDAVSAQEHVERAILRSRAGDLEGAVAENARALELAPGEFVPVMVRGRLLLDQGDLPGALEDFARASRLAPDAPEPWMNRGQALFRSKRWSDAAAAFEQAVPLDPSGRALGARAQAVWHTGDHPNALRLADEALGRDPLDPHLLRIRGALRRRSGDVPGALADLERSLELEPAPEGYAERALARRLAKDRAGALADLGRALELEPQNPETWSDRGALRLESDDAEGAVSDLTRALELDPRSTSARYNLAAALYTLGKRDESRAQLERILKEAPGTSAAADARQLLERLRRP